jgi:hypothetical protein
MGLMFLEACSGGGGGGLDGGGSFPQITVTISPRPLAVQKWTPNTPSFTSFTAKDSSNQLIPLSSITWSVDGTAINGSVDPNGLYTAPASVPPQNPVTVRAALVSDPSKNDAVSFYVLTGTTLGFSSSYDITSTINPQGTPPSFHIAVFNQNTYVTWATTFVTGGTHLWYSKGDLNGNFSAPHDLLGDIGDINSVTNGHNFENPVIAIDNMVDSSGDPGVYIAWDDNRSSNYQIYMVKGPNGKSCSGSLPCFEVLPAPNGRIDPSPSFDQRFPSVTFSPMGKLEFAWMQVYPSPLSGHSNLITYKELNADGSVAKPSSQVSPSQTQTSQITPQIAVDHSGNVSVSWLDFNSGTPPPNILYSRLRAGQPVFDSWIPVETDTLAPLNTFSMALDYNGQPHLAWSKTFVLNATTGIYYSTSDSTLANFISPVKLTIDGSNGYNPTIKVDLLNYLYLSWDDGMSTFFQKTGASPAPESLANPQWQILGVNPVLNVSPVMNIDDGGRVYLLYSTTVGSNPSTYYIRGD